MKAFLFLSLIVSLNAYSIINHDLKVEIKHNESYLKVTDLIQIKNQSCPNNLSFSLHEGLNPKIISPLSAALKLISKKTSDDNSVGTENYSLSLPCGTTQFQLSYEGIIFHPVKDPEDPYSRGTSDSPGLISKDGVVLSSTTNWYPIFDINDYLNFKIEVTDSDGFTYMSQGQKKAVNLFEENTPQEEIYLIGANFTLYENNNNPNHIISAYLRTPDDQMAQNYLNVTEGYINRYSKLIGDYPYSKFDLVENFWDTGFGMPSFTLLGSNIIRLPFIINTSYPHEILHDWWGNSVYVDFYRGNWCEGITAYMADHLMSELNNAGDTYRRDTLQKFTDYVTEKNDFPLNKFLNRYNAPTEAIGYGKALMFFHMLRLKLGDINFKNGFSHFYQNNKFKAVSYSEIEKSLESVSGLDLSSEFNQWVNRVGAPEIKIKSATVELINGLYEVSLSLSQNQSYDAFKVEIPIAITLSGIENAFQSKVLMNQKNGTYKFTFKEKPIFIQVDPEFDVFRKLSSDEVPTFLTMVLGAKKTYFVLPSLASSEEIEAYRNFSKLMIPALPKESEIKIITDSEISQIPSNSSVWLLSSKNLFLDRFNETIKDQGSLVDGQKLKINELELSLLENSFNITSRDNLNSSILNFVSLHDLNLSEILANKLIHYGKYSYLAFNGEKLTNKLKGVWKLNSSSMSIPLTFKDGTKIESRPAKLLKRGPLAN